MRQKKTIEVMKLGPRSLFQTINSFSKFTDMGRKLRINRWTKPRGCFMYTSSVRMPCKKAFLTS